ncbi:hypothetical protein ScPMuIL_006372 [Solemya velum]
MEIEVTVISTLSEDAPQGQFKVITPENNSVGKLIRKICIDKGFKAKTTYVLRDDTDSVLQWSQSLQDCSVSSGSVLYLCDNAGEASVRWGNSCNLWWFMAILSLAIGAGGLIAISVLKANELKTITDYGIVMDAGSSHTQVYVYSWDAAKFKETAVVWQIYSKKCPGPGISSYVGDVSALGPALKLCLDPVKSQVPSDKHASTPIYLGATAGMRLLEEVNQTLSDKVMQAVRDTIGKYPFKFTTPSNQARIITGDEEGTFSWVTSNYASDLLGVKAPMLSQLSAGDRTVGAMDMGGASTQLTFYPGTNVTLPLAYRKDIDLYGQNYTVYTHSFLCYGINEADRRFKAQLVKNQGYKETVKNPCGPKGNVTHNSYTYIFHAPCTQGQQAVEAFGSEINTTFTFEGTSDLTQCHEEVQKLFNFKAGCNYSSCSFNGTYQPTVHGKFYAFSNFFYEMQFLNLTKVMGHFTLKTFQTALASLCQASWNEVKNMKTVDQSFLPKYCFNGQFISALLTEGYRFDDSSWQNINFIGTINGTEIGWSLGFMLVSSNTIPVAVLEETISTVLFALLIVLFIVFVVIAIGFACHAKRYNKLRRRGLYEKINYGSI